MGEPFLRDVLSFYGANNSLSKTNLEDFLKLITSRRAPASVYHEENPLRSAEVKLMGSTSNIDIIPIFESFCLEILFD